MGAVPPGDGWEVETLAFTAHGDMRARKFVGEDQLFTVSNGVVQGRGALVLARGPQDGDNRCDSNATGQADDLFMLTGQIDAASGTTLNQDRRTTPIPGVQPRRDRMTGPSDEELEGAMARRGTDGVPSHLLLARNHAGKVNPLAREPRESFVFWPHLELEDALGKPSRFLDARLADHG